MMKKIPTEAIEDNSWSSVKKVAGNDDLIREILLRLPVRSLFNFILVSKHWLSLATDSQFLSQHFHRNPSLNPVSGLYFYSSLTSSNQIEFISLPNPPSRVRVSVPSFSFLNLAAKGGSFKIIQSCNGLLLCQLAYQSSDSTREYCVCNPTTKKFTIIPPPSSTISHEKAFGFSLAFDPSVSLHYKVVCIRLGNPPYNKNIEVDIYSSESSNWKTCNGSINWLIDSSPLRAGDLGKGIYWNGSINWIKQLDVGYEFYELYQFDIRKEIMDAYIYCSNQPLRYFGESNGRLHVIHIHSNSEKIFRVSERDRETQTWVVKYRVHICHLLSAFPEICQEINGIKEYSFSILSVYKGEKEEDSAMLMTIPGKVLSYNLHYTKAKVLHELPSMTVDTSHNDPISSFNFVESLAPV